MGSSKKHKKHKEKKHDESVGEQRPLKLVLKVGTSSATTSATSSPIKQETELKHQHDDGPPKLTLAYGHSSKAEEVSTHHSSAKKMKKKKSKKKHRKHSHHHSHHHHHHHRHRSSCSHHSKSSQHHDMSASINNLTLPSTLNATTSSIQPPLPKSPQRIPIPGKGGVKSGLQVFLSHLLKQLQRRDPQEFFAWPVTDKIAPGYSSIITRPMDFSTMKKKIEQNLYEAVSEFKGDVKLICDNAQVYNRPDTIYHKAARKLWRYAKDKIFNKESLMEHAKMHPTSSSEVGVTINESYMSDLSVVAGNDADKIQNTIDATEAAVTLEQDSVTMEDADDEENIAAEQILEQARKAAKAAADKLTLERPKGAHFSFLRQREDGSTTLGVLGYPAQERVIDLGTVVGKLAEGTAFLPPYKEPEENRIKPVESVDIPPYCSYLPALDSSRSSLTQEESSLLFSTYGEEELGLQYAQSLLQFSSDSDYVLNMVDSLLDVLTQGQHSKVVSKLKEEEMKTSEVEPMEEEVDEIQMQLKSTNSLICDLESMQHRRLCSSTQPVKPSKEETKLAHTLCSKLTELIGSYSTPGDISDVKGVRKALGVQVKVD